MVLYVDKVNYLEVMGPGSRFLVQSGPQYSVTLLSIDIKFIYQLEEKEIDVVEEQEPYSLIMSRWRRQRSRSKRQNQNIVSMCTIIN